MKCNEIRQHWNLYFDSEGDAEMHLQINEHLAICLECQQWFAAQSRLETTIAQRFKANREPSREMWDRIENRLAPVSRTSSRSWFFVAASVMALAAGVMVMAVLDINPLRNAGAPQLPRMSVALHDKLMSGLEDIAFCTNSHIEMEDYLKTQVSFPVRCPPRKDAGFQIRGGGILRFVDDPVAYVVGDVEGKGVSLFILDRKSLRNFPVDSAWLTNHNQQIARIGQSDVVMRAVDNNLVLVVGEVGKPKLNRVLNAYGTYGHNRRPENIEKRQHDG